MPSCAVKNGDTCKNGRHPWPESAATRRQGNRTTLYCRLCNIENCRDARAKKRGEGVSAEEAQQAAQFRPHEGDLCVAGKHPWPESARLRNDGKRYCDLCYKEKRYHAVYYERKKIVERFGGATRISKTYERKTDRILHKIEHVLEEFEFMRDAGMTFDHIASTIGLKPESLEMALHRAGWTKINGRWTS